MSNLPDLLAFIVTTLQLAEICRQVEVVSTDQFAEQQFVLRTRANLTNNDVLQVRYYYNHGHIDYAYQLVRADVPVLRWDNAEHFPNLSSYPHHFHAPSGIVEESILCGDPTADILLVLDYLAAMIKSEENAAP